jgi:hypothetical protein
MPFQHVTDISLVLDSKPEGAGLRYCAALFHGWPEDGRLLEEQHLGTPFYEVCVRSVQQSSDETAGASLLDWVAPPQSALRATFLRRCVEVGERGDLLRLWLFIGPTLAALPEYLAFEHRAKFGWESFWVREWAENVNRPLSVESPFIALNPWVTVLRRTLGVRVQRRFTVPGRLNVLIVVSNPPPGSKEWAHIQYLEGSGGKGMLLRAYRPFFHHPKVGWVSRMRNPTKVEFARWIRDHKPHVVIYLGHGYSAGPLGTGLVLPSGSEGKGFEYVSGVRKSPQLESELEHLLAGRWSKLTNGNGQDEGLRPDERPRLFIAFACEAAPAAPALLQCGVPAVLAMRSKIPDSDGTERMVSYFADLLTDEQRAVEEVVTGLRCFLKEHEAGFADERLHFSVPLFHLGTGGTGLDS